MHTIITMLSKLRVYWPSIVIYSLVAFYLISPIFSRSAVAEQAKTTLSHAKQLATAPTATYSGRPAKLTIKRLDIELTVEAGVYDSISQTWTLDDNHIFIDAFSNPDPVISTEHKVQPHTVLFYGHNTSKVLGKTASIVEGDILAIYTDNGYVFSYYYVGDEATQPNDVTILDKERESTPIALLTCGGIWDQYRRIMYFAPTGATPSSTLNNQESSSE